MAADESDSRSAMPDPDASRPTLFAACVLLILLTVATFADVTSFEFLIWDDEFFVVPHLQREGGITPSSIAWSCQARQGWFTPLPYLSLFLDASLYGLSPAGCHFTNLLIHLLNVVLVLLVFHRLTNSLVPSALAAAIFAIHPLHVEPVVWITTRWELLLGAFWLMGMWAYAHYCESRTWGSYVLVVAAYSAALLSKPMALTFPFALLLLDVWPLCRVRTPFVSLGRSTDRQVPAVTWRRALVEKLPLLAITVAAFCVAWRAKADFLATKEFVEFTVAERLLNSIETYAIYCGQFVWCRDLSFFYPHPALDEGFSLWRISLCLAVLLSISAVAILQFSRRPYLLVGWLWYLGVFVPAIGWVQVEQHARADRYTYLPLLGLSLMLCWPIWEACRSHWPRRVTLGLVSAGALLALACAAQQQASHWKDSRTLMNYGLQVNPRNYKARFNLGHLAVRRRDFEAAERQFRAGLAVYESSRGHYLVGRSLYLQGRIDEACASLKASLELDRSYVPAHGLLARCLLAQNQLAEANQQYETMLAESPESPLANVWYAEHLARREDHRRAAIYYRKALDLEPDGELVVMLLGESLEKSGQYAAAVHHYAEQYAARPRRVDIANRLAWLWATHPNAAARDGANAVQLANRLAELSGFQNRFVLDTLAAAYAEDASFSQAVKIADRAILLAENEQDATHLAELRDRRTLYASGRPYRDTQRFAASLIRNTARR